MKSRYRRPSAAARTSYGAPGFRARTSERSGIVEMK